MTAVKPRPAKGEAGSNASAQKRGKRAAARVKPGGDFVKVQIGRLELILDGLVGKANDGELAAIDRILKVLDRLDRYRGFSPSAAPAESGRRRARKNSAQTVGHRRAARSGRGRAKRWRR